MDAELDKIADQQLAKVGPNGETPGSLAQRIVSQRQAYLWFVDRPTRFSVEIEITDADIAALSEARRRVGDLIDHLLAHLPAPADLPDAEIVGRWHLDLLAASEHRAAANSGPARSLQIKVNETDDALGLAKILDGLAVVQQGVTQAPWIVPLLLSAIRGEQNSWCDRLRERLDEAAEVTATQVELLRRSVELPPNLLDNHEARGAIMRAAAGQKLWPLIAFGKSEPKALVAAIRIDGAAVPEGDTISWVHVNAVLFNVLREREAKARWDAFAKEIGAPFGQSNRDYKATVEFCQALVTVCDNARDQSTLLSSIVANAFTTEQVFKNANLCNGLAQQIRAAVASLRLSAAEQDRHRVLGLFSGSDLTSVLVQRLFSEVLGKTSSAQKVATVWSQILKRLADLKARSRDFETITAITQIIEQAGAPLWAARLKTETSTNSDALLPATWREAWDHAASDAFLTRIDERERLAKLANERGEAERHCSRLFGELVRARTFYELNRRLLPSIKSALVEFVRALAKIGKGTGKTAWIHRRAAREAMGRCYAAVPCWIMPTWRVAEQLPAELGALDLVIIDEASQSDVTELPALLRGKKILVVGDDRQVSPTPQFVAHEKIEQLRHHYLGGLPFKGLLEPGESIYDLMRAVFPNDRLMLKEHFRCVEPIIRFSMQFYPEKILPLRTPMAHERLDPPLVDIYVPHGTRPKHRKINVAEADVIVDEIRQLTANPVMKDRTIGVISLVGAEQAELVRTRLSEAIGEELMQRHAILCGDSATFQGTERDIVFLSMVADPQNKKALTMLRYEQRFNVAASRARDRLVLVRSVTREDLNPNDLKAKLIAHFENPMPEQEQHDDTLAACESGFERDVMRKLLDCGYSVQAQVGSLGYRIDMVVEGENGARLAIECDGDRYHGPEQWRQDMRRQRTLERVGWRFWRCFASSFYRDPDAVIADLTGMLSRMGIQPMGKRHSQSMRRYTEHRIVAPAPSISVAPIVEISSGLSDAREELFTEPAGGIRVGDKIVIIYSDSARRISLRLTQDTNDPTKGFFSVASPLGQAVLGAEEGDEIEVQLDDGRHRKALIEAVEKGKVFTDSAKRGNGRKPQFSPQPVTSVASEAPVN